jgi:ATP/maltotriose-dependent transcriptional regulator MalT
VPEATPRPWIAAVEAALGRKAGPAPARLAQAQRALALAQAQGWRDARLGLSWFAIGKAQTPLDPGAARDAYAAAYAVYATLPDGGVHAAHVAMQLAALDLRAGRPDAALAWVARARPALPVAENPALAATLTLIEAAVAEARGQLARARALRLDTAALARYGFGSTADVAAREAEIARLAGLPG